MTPEKLDEIERGLEGVTAGPWRVTGGATIRAGSRLLARMNWASAGETTTHIARLDPTTVAELVRLARIGLAAEARPDIAAVLRGEAVVVPREASGKMWSAGRAAIAGHAELIRGADHETASARADRIPGKVWAAMIAAGEKEMGK